MTLLRPSGWSATSGEGNAWLRSLARPGVVFRGMESAEFDATLGRGKPIQSSGRYSLESEGTCFSSHADEAESYVNFGRSDPRKTGRPTYLVEVESTPEMYHDTDDYHKCRVPVGTEHVLRVWKMDDHLGDGSVTAVPMSPVTHTARLVYHGHQYRRV